MLKSRSAPCPVDFHRSTNDVSNLGSRPRTFGETPRAGRPTPFGSSPHPRPFVRRRLSPEDGRALEILGHAIEYLADEYAADVEYKGPLGNADPRVKAIQILKGLNRSIYFSGAAVQPPFQRMRRWFAEYLMPQSSAK